MFARKLLGRSFALVTALLALPSATQAAETLWLDSNHSSYYGYYSSGTNLLFSGGGVNAVASAWSINNSGNVIKGQLGIWSYGLGVKNSSADNSHTIDNSGYSDFIVLQFDQAVSLEGAQLWTGWHNMTDVDATVGFGNSATPYTTELSLTGLTLGALPFSLSNVDSSGPVNAYWQGPNNIAFNGAGNVGNTWLIASSFSNPDRYADGFKLEKVMFSTPAVPEPATWAMLLIGFGAVGGALRAKKRRGNLAACQA